MNSASEMRTELNQDFLSLRRAAHSLNEMYKIMSKSAAPEFQALFTHRNADNRHCLRSDTRNDLVVPNCKIECGKQNFVYHGSIQWNKVPVFSSIPDACWN